MASKNLPKVGMAHIHLTYNNTIITITDNQGNALVSASGGRANKGARKATAHAAEEAAKSAVEVALSRGMLEVSIILKGAGNGRDSVMRAIANSRLNVLAISDVSPDQHAGCRRNKKNL